MTVTGSGGITVTAFPGEDVVALDEVTALDDVTAGGDDATGIGGDETTTGSAVAVFAGSSSHDVAVTSPRSGGSRRRSDLSTLAYSSSTGDKSDKSLSELQGSVKA